jgi:hypothetical protein
MNSGLFVWRVRFWLAAAAAVLVGLHAPKQLEGVARIDNRPHVAMVAAVARVNYPVHADSQAARTGCTTRLGDASALPLRPGC